MSGASPGRRGERPLGYWSTVLAVVGLVTLFRYFIFSLWHLWSLAEGRGGLSPQGADDGDFYLRTALDLAAGWTGVVVVNVYPAVIGYLMRTTGIYSVFFYKHLNFLGGMAVIAVGVLLYRRVRRWDSAPVPAHTDATSISLLVLLFGMYASPIAFEEFTLTRDGWIYLTHLLLMVVSLGIAQQRGMRRLALLPLLIPLIALLYNLRFYAPAGYAVGVLGWAGWSLLRRRFTVRGATIAAGAVLFLVLLVLLAGSKTFAADLVLASGVGLGSYRSGDPNTGGSSLGIDLINAPIPLQFPLYLYSTASNMLGPFPWQVHNTSTAAGFLVEVPMLSFVLWRVWRLRSEITRASSFLLWQAIAWSLVIGYFNDNLGTAFRLRVLGWHALFVLYVVLRQRQIDRRMWNPTRATARGPET